MQRYRVFKPCNPVAEKIETLDEGHRTFLLPVATWLLLVTSGVSLVSRPIAPVPCGELNEVSAAAHVLDSQGRLQGLMP